MQEPGVLQSTGSQGVRHDLAAAAAAKSLQSCPTLCDPMDYTVHGILQARILEPFPSPGDLPHPGIKLMSPTLQADALPAEPHQSSPASGYTYAISARVT